MHYALLKQFIGTAPFHIAAGQRLSEEILLWGKDLTVAPTRARSHLYSAANILATLVIV